MPITTENLAQGIWIAIALLLLIILYHLLFVVVDLKKIMRRLDKVTKEAEDIILSPLSLVDSILNSFAKMAGKKGSKKVINGKKANQK